MPYLGKRGGFQYLPTARYRRSMAVLPELAEELSVRCVNHICFLWLSIGTLTRHEQITTFGS
jgi:hypothetical protein